MKEGRGLAYLAGPGTTEFSIFHEQNHLQSSQRIATSQGKQQDDYHHEQMNKQRVNLQLLSGREH